MDDWLSSRIVVGSSDGFPSSETSLRIHTHSCDWRALRRLSGDACVTSDSLLSGVYMGHCGRCAHRCQLRLRARIPSSRQSGWLAHAQGGHVVGEWLGGGVQGGRLLGQMVAGWRPSRPLMLHRWVYLQELREHLPNLKRMQSSQPSFVWVTVWLAEGVDVTLATGKNGRSVLGGDPWRRCREGCWHGVKKESGVPAGARSLLNLMNLPLQMCLSVLLDRGVTQVMNGEGPSVRKWLLW